MEKEQRYVHFASSKHLLTPIAIGTSHPPVQVSILGPNPAAVEPNANQSLELSAEMVIGKASLLTSSSMRFGIGSNQNAYRVCRTLPLFSYIGSE